MNKARRKQIVKAKNYLNEAADIIQDVLNDEDMAYNNLSEGLQCTARGEQMESNIDDLEEIIDNLMEIINSLDSID